MALYELGANAISPVTLATFAEVGVREREDVQRLLRSNIGIIAHGCLVIAEEFHQWEDSKRRIDLLAIDSEAKLVVIELKRTETGGLMELQALRYAAMVSTITYAQAVSTFRRHLEQVGEDPAEAETRLLDHLGWDGPAEEDFAQSVRIVLVSAEFSKELMTSVLWLNHQGLDIRCVRLRPYRHGNRVLLDIQQVIPLPEAEEYQVRIREKEAEERTGKLHQRDLTRYNVVINGLRHTDLPKRRAMLLIVLALTRAGIPPERIQSLLSWRGKGLFARADGTHNAASMRAAIEAIRASGERHRAPSRFFCEEDEHLIHCDGSTYAFSSQWGDRSEEAMTILTSSHPEAGVTFERSEGV